MKISQLVSAGTAESGDVMPIVRGGFTRSLTIGSIVQLIPAGQTGPQGIQGPPGPAWTPTYTVLANGAAAMDFAVNSTVKVTPTANATYTTTVPAAGLSRYLIVLTSGTTSRTITFGTGFKPTATLATGTVTARVFVLHFISDGTNLYEASRTVAIVA
jgi:hypothetical protein